MRYLVGTLFFGPCLLMLGLASWSTGMSLVQRAFTRWDQATATITHLETFPTPSETAGSGEPDMDEFWVRYEFEVEGQVYHGYHNQTQDLQRMLNEFERGREHSVRFQAGAPQENFLTAEAEKEDLVGLIVIFLLATFFLIVLTWVFANTVAPEWLKSVGVRLWGDPERSQLKRVR